MLKTCLETDTFETMTTTLIMYVHLEVRLQFAEDDDQVQESSV